MKKYKKGQSKLQRTSSGLNPALKENLPSERQGVVPTVGMLNVAREKAKEEEKRKVIHPAKMHGSAEASSVDAVA